MKNLQFLLLCALLSLLSCDKDDPITAISGHVTTLGTTDPVVDAKIVLYGGVSNGNFSNPGTYVSRIDSVYTDVAGFYEFSFDASRYPVLDMVAEKESYFTKDVKQGLVSRRENVADIVMDPFAWLKLHVKNVMPVNVDDGISVDGSWGGGGVLDTWGETVDEMIIVKVIGNKEHFVKWNVNGASNFIENVYCPAQDTTLFEIFY
ncbi:MAG: hypothetical protein ACI8YQ_000376 [Polaribacter sp.]|jgi:hypothetical protein